MVGLQKEEVQGMREINTSTGCSLLTKKKSSDSTSLNPCQEQKRISRKRAYGRKYVRSTKGRENNRETNRRWRETNRDRVNEIAKRYNANNKDKLRVRRIVRDAVADGTLVKGECEIGIDCRGRIESHHDDYSKPLEVRWLCRKHHSKLRRIN